MNLGRVRKEGGNVKRGAYKTGGLTFALLAIAIAIPFPALAQRGFYHPPRQWHRTPALQAQRPPSARPPGHVPRGHAGDWLRRYKDLPPAEQERALRNDPSFQRLPPERQQALRQRLQHFSSLPPQQQLRMLNRMETWEHLTPAQKTQARQIFGQMRQLPPARQRMVITAVHDLRGMPPAQREQIINSPRFRSMFSDQERDMMRAATRLPLAPPEE